MKVVFLSIIFLILIVVIFRLFSKGKNSNQELIENDVKRFARLLVSEIKLLNEYKVRQGLKNNNLDEFLNTEIEEARQIFKKRCSGADCDRHFDAALVEILADGDKSKLGTLLMH